MLARGPLTYGTLIALLAVLPLVVMQGRPGAFFEPIAVAYIAAVLASTLVAVTVTPALTRVLAPRSERVRSEPALMRRIGGVYAGALARVVAAPRKAILAAGGCAVVGLAILPLLGTSLVPSFKDRDLVVHLDAKPGTSQPAMTRIVRAANAKLQAIDGVKDVGAHIGRAVTGDQVVDVNSSELWVAIDRSADYDKTVAAVRRAVDGMRGSDRDVVTYTQQKIRDVGTLTNGERAGKDGTLAELTGTREPLEVRVFGEDLQVLRATAEKVRTLVSGVDGVVAPRLDQPARDVEPTLEIQVNLDAARRHGIKPGDVRRAEATLLQGISVGSIFGKEKVFDVVVQGIPSLRTSVANVRNLLIDRQDGGSVRLGDVANVTVKTAPSVIKRDDVSRRIDVVAGIKGRGTGAVERDVKARLAGATFFPLEYHAEVLTDSAAKEIGATAIAGSALAALIAMFLLLQAALRSWRIAVALFVALPVALTGGVLAALLDGAELSLGSMLGLVAIFAIATRGSLLVVKRMQQLGEDAGCGAPSPALVQEGARDLLSPILVATLATAAFVAPFVVRGVIPGLEIVHPMATVIFGGLVTSALLTMFVVPALYLRFATQPEPVEDLLHRWAGVPGEGEAVEADRWVVVNPEVERALAQRKRILPRAEPEADEGPPEAEPTTEPAAKPPTQGS